MDVLRKWYILLLMAGVAFSQTRSIKPGDAIEIVVYGHQELSRVVNVNPQGTIDFPFLQSWPVNGLTLEELREVIVAKLSRYLSASPLITVGFARSNTINISVLGMVQRPGIVQIPLYSTLQGAITAAGGFLPGARINEIVVMRNENGKMASHSYDLAVFLRNNDLEQNPILEEADAIIVPGNPWLTPVKVVGAVRTPGQYNTHDGATVLEAVMQAGGPLEDADMSNIVMVSPGEKQSKELKLDLKKAIQKRDLTGLPIVKADDIIFIPRKTGYWRYLLNATRDASTIALAVYYVSRIRR
jgi:polysaccharide export outer membrane protein